jgi:hypothetical protein
MYPERSPAKTTCTECQLNSAPEPRRPVPSDFLRARADKLLSDLTQPVADAPTGMAVTRPAAVNDDRPLLGWRPGRGFSGFLLAAACAGLAAIAWQSFHAYKAKQPQLVQTSALETPELPAQPSPPTAQAEVAKPDVTKADPAKADAKAELAKAAPPPPQLVAQAAPKDAAPTTGALPPDLAQLLQRRDAANVAPLPPAAPAQLVPESVAPTTAALPPDLAQVLQTMSRELASVGQGIEQLKASQEQMARDNARIAEQLKANQEQLGRLAARAPEQNQRPKTSVALPPRPAR